MATGLMRDELNRNKFTIVILRGRESSLQKLGDFISRQREGFQFVVIVVNLPQNNNGLATLKFPPLQVYELTKPCPFAYVYNRLIDRLKGGSRVEIIARYLRKKRAKVNVIDQILRPLPSRHDIRKLVTEIRTIAPSVDRVAFVDDESVLLARAVGISLGALHVGSLAAS